MSERSKAKAPSTLDFSGDIASPPVKTFSQHAFLGGFSVCQCTFLPNAGTTFDVRQLVIGISIGAPFTLSSRPNMPDQAIRVKSAQAVIVGPESRQYLEWGDTEPRFNIVAIEKATIDRILLEANSNPRSRLQPTFGVRDNVVRQLVQVCYDEIAECGECGRLFMDSLASAIVTHVYRTYANATFPKIAKGGLTPRDAKRVLDYIEEHLHTDIGLEELSRSVSLSAHYFTYAFKKKLGMPPYRYLLHRRVERAKELLLAADLSPAKIAEEVGFSSQSQLTTNFRKIVGTTPARFRRDAQ